MLVLAALVASLLRPAWIAAPPPPLDAPAWRDATHEQFSTTDVYLLEDGKYMYVRFDAQQRDASGDDVALYLWSDTAAYAFTVDANGTLSAKCSTGAAPQWSAHTTPVANGYAVTMRLPQVMFHGGQSRWLVQFARETPAGSSTWPASDGQAGNVLYAQAFAPSAERAFSAAVYTSRSQPTVAPAGQAKKFWPASSPLAAPAISSNAQGVAVAQAHDHLRFTGVEAKSNNGTQSDAQSLAWSSSDGHASAGVERIANSSGTAFDVTQALSVAFDNKQNIRISAGVAADRGSGVDDPSLANYSFYDFSLYGQNSALDMRWNSAGPQYGASGTDTPAPGANGFTLSASRAFGAVSVHAKADRYRDDLGNLADADARAAISTALTPALTFDLDAASNSGTQYASLPYAQSGASMRYAGDGRQAQVSYHEDRYSGGFARELALSGGFTLPVVGTLQLDHRERSTSGLLAFTEPEQSSMASLRHRLKNGSVSVGYQYAGGAANVTFAFEDQLPIGLLRATYYNPNTRFSAPNFSLKFVGL